MHKVMRRTLFIIAYALWGMVCYLFLQPLPDYYSGIEIVGDLRFRNRVAHALALIDRSSFPQFESVSRNVKRIREASRTRMMPSSDPPTLFLDRNRAYYSVSWCAADIVQSGCHARHFQEYRLENGKKPPDQVWQGKTAEMSCLHERLEFMRKSRAPLMEVRQVEQRLK